MQVLIEKQPGTNPVTNTDDRNQGTSKGSKILSVTLPSSYLPSAEPMKTPDNAKNAGDWKIQVEHNIAANTRSQHGSDDTHMLAIDNSQGVISEHSRRTVRETGNSDSAMADIGVIQEFRPRISERYEKPVADLRDNLENIVQRFQQHINQLFEDKQNKRNMLDQDSIDPIRNHGASRPTIIRQMKCHTSVFETLKLLTSKEIELTEKDLDDLKGEVKEEIENARSIQLFDETTKAALISTLKSIEQEIIDLEASIKNKIDETIYPPENMKRCKENEECRKTKVTDRKQGRGKPEESKSIDTILRRKHSATLEQQNPLNLFIERIADDDKQLIDDSLQKTNEMISKISDVFNELNTLIEKWLTDALKSDPVDHQTYSKFLEYLEVHGENRLKAEADVAKDEIKQLLIDNIGMHREYIKDAYKSIPTASDTAAAIVIIDSMNTEQSSRASKIDKSIDNEIASRIKAVKHLRQLLDKEIPSFLSKAQAMSKAERMNPEAFRNLNAQFPITKILMEPDYQVLESLPEIINDQWLKSFKPVTCDASLEEMREHAKASTESQEASTESQEASTEPQKAPTEPQKATTESQEVSTESQEVSTESQEVSTKPQIVIIEESDEFGRTTPQTGSVTNKAINTRAESSEKPDSSETSIAKDNIFPAKEKDTQIATVVPVPSPEAPEPENRDDMEISGSGDIPIVTPLSRLKSQLASLLNQADEKIEIEISMLEGTLKRFNNHLEQSKYNSKEYNQASFQQQAGDSFFYEQFNDIELAMDELGTPKKQNIDNQAWDANIKTAKGHLQQKLEKAYNDKIRDEYNLTYDQLRVRKVSVRHPRSPAAREDIEHSPVGPGVSRPGFFEPDVVTATSGLLPGLSSFLLSTYHWITGTGAEHETASLPYQEQPAGVDPIKPPRYQASHQAANVAPRVSRPVTAKMSEPWQSANTPGQITGGGGSVGDNISINNVDSSALPLLSMLLAKISGQDKIVSNDNPALSVPDQDVSSEIVNNPASNRRARDVRGAAEYLQSAKFKDMFGFRPGQSLDTRLPSKD